MTVAADRGARRRLDPDLEGARAQAREANVIPVTRRFIDDLETPVSAFLKLRAALGGGPSFLLESAEQGRLGRYSFLGFRPHVVLGWTDGVLKEWTGAAIAAAGHGGPEAWGEPATRVDAPDPYAAVADYLGRYELAAAELPPFAGGAVGYFGYDLVRAIEPLGPPNPDPLGLPDMSLMLCELLVAFDHQRHEVTMVGYAFVDEEGIDPAYARATTLIEAAQSALHDPVPRRANPFADPAAPGREAEEAAGMDSGAGAGDVAGVDSGAEFRSNMTREQFEANVSRIIEYIRAGDAFQVVPSQRFSAPAPVEAFSIYRGLRTINPSPYMYYLEFGDFQIAGASPEPLVKVSGRRAETRPIAGTYPRGPNEDEDRRRAERLLADPKERAEHVMLVDLGRNDLGRVCEYGSVSVDELMVVETYSHVLHIVSQVSGRLREGVTAMDALRAVLPAGTLSGAPKVRAMQIIDELEPVKRCSYGGAVGYLSFTGDLDTAIHIRTVVVKDGTIHIQAGGGTVVDAKPDYEYEESVSKAKAIFQAVKLAASQPEWP
ncbi:MAG TPA: anthranilate synthase component I [Solirubrobacterales bacterium]|nr:anthranilate synthase component I [Solirubrobacterales bacterium]